MATAAEENVNRMAYISSQSGGSVGRAGHNWPNDVLQIQSLLNAQGYSMPVDGVADYALSRAIMDFQRKLGLDVLTGTVYPGDETYLALHGNKGQSDVLPPARGGLPIQPEDFAWAAQRLGCEVAAIKAVTWVEGFKGRPWFPSGRPSMLFEAHLFSGFTKHAYDLTHRDISHGYQGGYQFGEAEYPRLQKAMRLNRDAALRATGWGAFGIQGEYYKQCGHRSVDAFVFAMFMSAGEHLGAFVNLLINTNHAAHMALRYKNWATFALNYNGREYKKNHYDINLENAYYNAKLQEKQTK